MTLDATIRAVQAKLGVTVDGNPGPQTWNSIYRSLVGEPPVSSVPATLADERSERTIATLLPQVQPLARALIESAAAIGIAFDIGVFEGGRYLDESPAYKAVGALGEQLGLEWGGDWKSIQDEPHFELRPSWARDMSEGALLAELRNRRAANREVFA